MVNGHSHVRRSIFPPLTAVWTESSDGDVEMEIHSGVAVLGDGQLPEIPRAEPESKAFEPLRQPPFGRMLRKYWPES